MLIDAQADLNPRKPCSGYTILHKETRGLSSQSLERNRACCEASCKDIARAPSSCEFVNCLQDQVLLYCETQCSLAHLLEQRLDANARMTGYSLPPYVCFDVWTTLGIAMHFLNTLSLKQLLLARADPNIAGFCGEFQTSPLDMIRLYADCNRGIPSYPPHIEDQQRACFRVLLEAKADPDSPCKDSGASSWQLGLTRRWQLPLFSRIHDFIDLDRDDLVLELVRARADISHQDHISHLSQESCGPRSPLKRLGKAYVCSLMHELI